MDVLIKPLCALLSLCKHLCIALLADFHLVFVNVRHCSSCLLLFFYLFIIICAVLCGAKRLKWNFLGEFPAGGIKDLLI